MIENDELYHYLVTDYKGNSYRVTAKDNLDAKSQVCRLNGKSVTPFERDKFKAKRIGTAV